MPTASAQFVGTRANLTALLRSAVRIFAGVEADSFDIAKGVQLRIGVALLSKIQQSFIVKSRGGTDEAGIKWQPLKRETIAQRRTTTKEKFGFRIQGKRVRGLLTPAQDRLWRKIFGSRKALFMSKFGLGEKEASARAAKIAWAILKAQGAKTKLEVLGGRVVDVLRDTGELFRSFSPGVEDRPSRADGQVFQTTPGRVIVGTNKKPWHHAGIPGRLPSRPFWPLDNTLPDAWWDALLLAGQRGVLKAFTLLLERRA